MAELSSFDKVRKSNVSTIKPFTGEKKKANPCFRAVTKAKFGVEAQRM